MKSININLIILIINIIINLSKNFGINKVTIKEQKNRKLYYRDDDYDENISEHRIIKETIEELEKFSRKIKRVKKVSVKYLYHAEDTLKAYGNENNPLGNILLAYYNKKNKDRHNFIMSSLMGPSLNPYNTIVSTQTESNTVEKDNKPN